MTRLERMIGLVLRVGVTTSSICLTAGLLLSLFDGGGSIARVLLHTGIIVLLATPIVRVAVSVAEFFVMRDWLFFMLTTIVFVELLGSVVAAVVARAH